ncbi:MAG: helix-turn-helix domain-containing protein [Ruminococcus sp.]|nr:helix-turn-helix domain-containing protein [Ruminococcus sp.]
MNEVKIGEIIKERRAVKGISQETLASVCGVSMQAVSKWENGQSCPDITFLPLLAEYFQISIDYLLTGKKSRPESGATPESEPNRIPESDNALEGLKGMTEKDTLYIIQYRNGRILDHKVWEQNGPHKDEAIPIVFEEDFCSLKNGLHMEIWGNASIEAENISMNLYAGGNVACGSVDGNVASEGSVACGSVDGSVTSEGSVACGSVDGSVTSGGNVKCGSVDGYVSADGNVECGSVDGNVSAGGNVTCDDIGGDVQAGSTITCHDISGSAKAETIQYIND